MGYRFGFIGWCKTEKHDKIWGWIEPDEAFDLPIHAIRDDVQFVNFWGRRGAKLTFKRYTGSYGLNQLKNMTREKQNRAQDPYTLVTAEGLERVTLNFVDNFERQLFKAKLFRSFHRE